MPKLWRSCPHCGRYSVSVRLYIRAPNGRGYSPIGWHCTRCGASALDVPYIQSLPAYPQHEHVQEVPT